MKTVDSPQFPITAFDNVKVNNKKCEYNVIYCTLLFPTLLGHVLLTKSLNCGKSTGKKKRCTFHFVPVFMNAVKSLSGHRRRNVYHGYICFALSEHKQLFKQNFRKL